MKRLPILFLAGVLMLCACDQKGQVPKSESDFVMRLKRAQDTVTIFEHQQELKNRIITNMSKYVANNMNFADWSFRVEKMSDSELGLKVPAPKDTTGYNVRFVLPLGGDAKLKEALAKVKEGDFIKVDGEIDMKTADGKVSMNDYFLTDSARFIKLSARVIK